MSVSVVWVTGGRVRYSRLKGAAVGEALCKFNGVGFMREACGTAAGTGKSEGGSGYGCSFRALGAGRGAEVGNGQLVWG